MFSEIVRSVKVPLKLIPVVNTDVPYDEEKANEEANADNLLLKQTMEWDGMQAKLIELGVMLFKYGNIPVTIEWKRKVAEVLTWVTLPNGEKILERVETSIANYPSMKWFLPTNLYLDTNIGDVQQQSCIMVKGPVGIGDVISEVKAGELINFDEINSSYLYTGDDTSTTTDKQSNAGLGSISDMDTGVFMRFDGYCMLPIDETRPEGSRWDTMKNIPQKYWVTLLTSNTPGAGLVMRIQRNRDPDDLYPIEIIPWMPDDTDQAFKVSLAQLQRGNYSEATTSKLQAIDARTLNNNRPIKIKRGNVKNADGTNTLKWDKDAVFECEEDIHKDIGVEPAVQVPDNIMTMNYLDADSDEIAGTGPVMRGEAMGGRTSSTEASNAYNSAARPHMMKFRYTFEKLFGFYSRIMRYWHVYGDEQVMVRASGKGKTVAVNPRSLTVNYDTEVICVDEFEKNSLQQDKFAYAARTMIPLFGPVLDLRKMAVKVFDEIMDWDVKPMILADNSKEEAVEAKYENGVLMQGRYIPINADDNDDVHIEQHSGERVRYNGLEQDPRFAWVPLLDRHIEEHKLSKTNKAQRAAAVNQAQQQGSAPAEAPSGNQTVGQADGNAIAAQLGAQNGGS